MAGESPDRSKQRESSAETTSGSAGPVPEARSSTEPRDPRLAVARETAPSSGSPERGQVDTATRVLSVREATDKPERASAEPTEPGGRDEAGTDGDGRLRDAVAAWVRSAEDAEASGPGDGAGRDSEAAAGEAESADTGAEGGSDSAPARTDEGPGSPADGTPADAAEGEADGAGTDDARADGTGAAAAAPEDTQAGGRRTGAVKIRKEEPAPADSKAEDDSAPAHATKSEADGAGTDDARADGTGAAAAAPEDTQAGGRTGAVKIRKEEPAPADSGAEDDGAPADTVDAEADAADTEGARADGTGAAAAAPEDTQAGGRRTGAVKIRKEKPAPADSEAEDDSAPTDTVEAGNGAGGGSGSAPADRPGASGATAAARAAKTAGTDPARTDEDPGSPADSTPADATEGDAGSAPADAPQAGGSSAARAGDDAPEEPEDAPPAGGDGARNGAVDQPTAVFKTMRSSSPSVDQPTTMLKLGDSAKTSRGAADEDAAKSDARSGSRSDSGSESESERTSKFVALKALDDPTTRKPAPAPEEKAPAPATSPAAPPAPAPDATTALPQVGPERTAQQPLPPKPPLDLLAELTNTPPPPETPLRTAVRRVKIWTPLVLLLVIVFAVVQNMRPLPSPTLELTADGSYTFDGGKPDIPWPSEGQAALDVQGIGSFGSSGEQKPVPIASVAKVMTAYVILRDHPLKSGAKGPMIDIDKTAEKQADAGQESTVPVTAGDQISQREALESILIASANNVARLLARWDAGSEKAFVEKMNDAAKDLGMTNTTYTDPSGLNDTTVSTAVDQVMLAEAAMKQPAFREVAAMMSYDDYKGNNHSNYNQLVGRNNVVGIKTGTTTSALGNLVFAAKKEVDGETRTIIGAVLRQPAGGPENTILSAALSAGDQLIRAAQGALESATILEKGTVVGYADDGLGGRTPVVATEDVKAVGWAGLSVEVNFAAEKLPHRAKAGTKVGTLNVGDGTSSAVKVPVALQRDLVEPGFTDKLTRIA